MAYDPEFGDWVTDHLSGLGPIEIKRMFGAAGVKQHGAMFAILDDGVIWLKATGELAEALKAEGARQFTYSTRDGETMSMAYWSLPETALDDPEEAVARAKRSLEQALRPRSKAPRKTSPG